MYRFPGRRLFEWLLLLPLAIPTYIIAFCYLELFDYSGVLQTSLRSLFGWRNAQDYWFPDIRSLGGAIFVMSAVLYPYVYITARASFLAQSVCVLEVSRTLGRTAPATFWEVALPLARPALAAGVALALMETLNDIGAVEFFGVRTLTVAIYDTWLDRNSLAGAAQIACIMLAFVFAVLASSGRCGQAVAFTTPPAAIGISPRSRFKALAARLPPSPARSLSCSDSFCRAPSSCATRAVHVAAGLSPEFWRAAVNSLSAAGCRRLSRRRLRRGARLCAAADAVEAHPRLERRARHQLRGSRHRARDRHPHSPRQPRQRHRCPHALAVRRADRALLSGSVFALVLAYTIRFLAASFGAVEAGLSKISRNTDAAARTLGATISETLWRVHLPLLRPALGAAALLVFVDSMKELPATLLLRPFNFDTLATQVFTLASLYRYEEAGLSALTIVAASLAPVFCSTA